jgi:O-antigen/teichoic acid export membrane protein
MVKERTARATFWSSLDVLLRQGIQFLTVMALARLLTPTDFGTLAILYLFTGIASTLIDGGLSTALIQRQRLTVEDECTVFWLNTGIGFIVALLFIGFSRTLADAFGLPELSALAILMGLSVFASSFGIVQQALMTKRLDFRRQTVAGAGAALIAGTTSITLALKGYGVLSLGAQVFTMAVSFSVLLWFLSGWRPRMTFNFRSARNLFNFGGYVLFANVMDMMYTRAYTLLIGRYVGVAELGFYDRAEQTRQLPSNFVAGTLGRILLPVFSEACGDVQQLRYRMKVAIGGLMLVNLPVMLFLAALAEPFMLTIYGEKWLPAVGPFRLLCFAAALWPMHLVNINAFLAQGHSRLVFRLEFPKKMLGLCLLGAGVFFGIDGVAWSQVVVSLLAFIINAYFGGRVLGYGFRQQTLDMLAPLALSAAVGLLAHAAATLLALSPALELVLLFAAAGIAYAWLGYMLRIVAFHDARELLTRPLKRTGRGNNESRA